MAGQGTATLELIEDGGDLDLLLVPVGGGGLIAGLARPPPRRCARTAAWSASSPRSATTRPARSPPASASASRSGARSPTASSSTSPGERTFPVVRERVAAVVTVSDAELVAAMRFAFERLKLVLEPSGASALAALLHGRVERRRPALRRDPLGRQRRRRALPRADRLTDGYAHPVRTAILTVSTSVANRASEDRSGPVLAGAGRGGGLRDRRHGGRARRLRADRGPAAPLRRPELRPDLHDGRDGHDARRHHARGDARDHPPRGARARRGDARRVGQAHAARHPHARRRRHRRVDADRELPRQPEARSSSSSPSSRPVLEHAVQTLRGDSSHGNGRAGG